MGKAVKRKEISAAIAERALVALDIEGEWNVPLLENAAEISGSELICAVSGGAGCLFNNPKGEVQFVEDALAPFDHVIACETARGGVSIFDYPAPRGKVALLVGNEVRGITRCVLKEADATVSIPMRGSGMSSLNVAVAGAVDLYVLTRDLARKRMPKAPLKRRKVDVLINAPSDPHELGSLLRSAWSFGWRRAFVSDPYGVWFTKDRRAVLDGRSAARKSKNPLVVLPLESLDLDSYDRFLSCAGGREGIPLSRLRLPSRGRLLVVYGSGPNISLQTVKSESTFVDTLDTDVTPRFRHGGSILLSVVSEMLASRR